jgi:hypothetical protein
LSSGRGWGTLGAHDGGAAMITPEEFVERLCLVAADRGPRGLPRKRRDRQILMKSITLLLDSDRTYGEPEINELLQAWKREVAPAIATDHVTLRRPRAGAASRRKRRGRGVAAS